MNLKRSVIDLEIELAIIVSGFVLFIIGLFASELLALMGAISILVGACCFVLKQMKKERD